MRLLLIGIACICSAFQFAVAQQSILVFFDFDKACLTKESKRLLAGISGNSKVDSIAIYGHCDQFGTAAYNYKLSDKRVAAVKDYLVKNGFILSRISTTNGYGEDQLINKETDPVARKANRRVEIIFHYTPVSASKQMDSVMQPTLPTEGEVKKSTPTLLEQIKDSTGTVNQNIILKHINFVGGRDIFLQMAYAPLEELLATMQQLPALEIEIQGHICCVEGPQDGMDNGTGEPILSHNRAKAVYNFLVENGISKSRMSYRGLGHQFPLVAIERSPMDATINRRVEIKIVKR